MGMWFLCSIKVQTHSCKAMDIMSIDSLKQNNLWTCWSRIQNGALVRRYTVKLTPSGYSRSFYFWWVKYRRIGCFISAPSQKASLKSPADALACGTYPYPSLVHIHECVCIGIYECEDGPFLPLKMTHKTSVLATYAVKAASGMPFQHSRTSGWVPFTREISLTWEKVPALCRGSCPEGWCSSCPRASLLHLPA